MKNLLLFLAMCLILVGCSASRQSGIQSMSSGTEQAIDDMQDYIDEGLVEIPGDPTLLAGISNLPSPGESWPMSRTTAVAGVDFASNRFIVIWENQPDPAALAVFLGGSQNANVVRALDNAPLVDHPYFRRVSHNLADHYGFSEFNRVFFHDVNFSTFEVSSIADVSQLDALMQRVLNENVGLVREVGYDFIIEVSSPDLQDGRIIDNGEIRRIVDDSFFGGPVSSDPGRTVSAAPDDPMHLNKSGPDGGTWANWRMGTVDGQAWDSTTGSATVVVAVVDTGVRYTHEDLVDNTIEPAATFPYNEPGIMTDVYYRDNDPIDDHGHGTLCSGCVGAVGDNSKGLAGMNQVVSILPIKVLSSGGNGSLANAAEGLLVADYLGANVISMSLGWDFPATVMQLAAKQAIDDGMIFVTSAGNNNDSAPHYPGTYPYCLNVGATTLVNDSDNQDLSLVDGSLPISSRHDARVYFSNYGDWVDVAAPGIYVRSTNRASDTAYSASVAGTSFSCPYTAGCVALLWAHMGLDKTNNEVRGMLQSGATEMTHFNNGSTPRGFIDDTSNGPVRFVNVWESIKIYDDGPYDAPTVTWNNPTDGSTVSGDVDLQVTVTGGDGNIVKVEFDIPTRHLGTAEAESGGFWQVSWDSDFDFNREMTIMAKVHDDVGNIVHVPVTITPDNTHVTPSWTEDFTGVTLGEIPADWFTWDHNGSPASNTSWGADDAQSGAASPSMHSSGTTANYVAYSNDWLFAPIIDLTDFASAEVSFDRRYDRGSNDYFFFFATSDDENFDGDIFSEGGLQDWDTYTFNLDDFCGDEVRLIWVLNANGSGQDVGMWFDDVEINVATGTPPTIDITSPEIGASVNGMVTVSMTVSDDTTDIEVWGIPVGIGSVVYSSIPDNDPGNPTKTFDISWDSRHTWNGAALITATAYDDEGDDGGLDDFSATDSVALTIDNANKTPGWYEDFEDITDLGGTDNGEFDGDWYVWGSDEERWRIGSHDAWQGSQHAYMGPDGGGDYGANEFDRLYSPVIDNSSAANPYIRFWHKLDVESGTGDRCKIYLVRYDDLVTLELPIFDLLADTTGYERVTFDLGEFAADPFRLYFLFDSDNDSDAGTGWSLDDFEVLDVDPTIVDIVDPSGHPGKVVTINGSNFGNVQGQSVVSFQKDGGGLTNPTITAWSNDTISLEVPADSISGDVFVTVIDVDSNAVYFGVTLPPPSLDGLGQI